MSRFRTYMLTGSLAGVVLGCGGGTGPDLPNVVGTWNATKIQVTNKANVAQTSNLTLLGATLTVVFRSDNTFTATFAAPGQPADASTGTWTQNSSTLTLTDDSSSGSDVNTFAYTVSGGTLTLSGGEIDFDFGSGDVPSKFDLILVH